MDELRGKRLRPPRHHGGVPDLAHRSRGAPLAVARLASLRPKANISRVSIILSVVSHERPGHPDAGRHSRTGVGGGGRGGARDLYRYAGGANSVSLLFPHWIVLRFGWGRSVYRWWL